MNAPAFHDEPALSLENRLLRLDYLAAAPRIVRLTPAGKANLFVDLGDRGLTTPYGVFRFRGGHRLWRAPETMPGTYMPDNDGATVTGLAGGVRIEQPPEPDTGLVKALEIRLDPREAVVTIRHELRNEGPQRLMLAPWALTMLRLGGVAIFPQPTGNADPAGLLSNRTLSLWPYTRINDPRLVLGDEFILLRASLGASALKFGYSNLHGWMGYYLDGTFFVKRFDPVPGADYPDGGCNTESYCNDQFIELESLGPLAALEPGETVVHTERWEVYDGLSMPELSEAARRALEAT